MKFWKLVFVSLFLISNISYADKRSEWLAERQEWLDRAKSSQNPDEFVKLYRIVRGVGEHLSTASPEARELYHQALDLLRLIPGHAEYYRDRILKARLEYEDAKANASSDRSSYLRSQLSSIQTEGFRTMAYLPSVETVRVLGEFLSDERGYIKVPPNPSLRALEIAALETPNCEGAVQALVCLPIVSKPLDRDWFTVGYQEAEIWRVWYDQIKSGKRTFRFEGDPTEYDLNGPAAKEKLARIERDQRRDEARLAGHRKSGSASESAATVSAQLRKPSTLAGILAALALVGVAISYSMRKRKSRRT